MGRLGALFLVLLAGALVGGCAGSTVEKPPSLLTVSPPTSEAAAHGYELSKKELGYGCKKLAGVMQVRILQIRGYDTRKKASMAARGMQGVATPIFGGTTEGLDPDGQYRRDLAMLDAYNRRLAEKNCNTFDLAAELRGTDLYDTPRPKGAKKSN